MNKLSKSEIIVIVIGIVIVAAILFYIISKKTSSTNTPIMNTPQAQGTNISTDPKVQIIETQAGTGAEAKNGSHVYVNYNGTLTNGTKFDSSYDRGEPIDFVLGTGGVIKGWDIGLLGMKVGGKRHFVISPEYGYGAQGIGPIPPNATLVFDVELMDVK
jgi:FKBP-type peptidyl-prolyl cis-trans isomerase